MSAVRPSAGRIVRALDGAEVALRFVPTEDPRVFLAVTVDGDQVDVEAGDELHVDVIGPGQTIVFAMASER